MLYHLKQHGTLLDTPCTAEISEAIDEDGTYDGLAATVAHPITQALLVQCSLSLSLF
jgi:hypothetical protein